MTNDTSVKKEKKAPRHTLSVLVNHNLNAISRIIGIFSGKGFEIDSMSYGTEEESGKARITITTRGDETIIEQITKQLHKIVDVLKVNDLTYDQFVDRELALVKVSASSSERSEIMQLAQVFRAKIIDISTEKMGVEVTGNQDKIDALIGMLRPYGISEIARTGTVALRREYSGKV